MRPLQPFASVLLSGLLLAMAPAFFSPASAAEARIEDFRFECRAPDGKRLKPKFGDVDGVFFTGLPGQRDACIAAVDRMIATCHENTSFTSNTRNREYAGCLPIFKAQAQECAAFFRNERHKCDAGGSGSAGLGDGGAAPDPWSDGGSTGGDSVWDPPAAEAADSGDRTRTAAWASPAPAADGGGGADRDVSSYASALLRGPGRRAAAGSGAGRLHRRPGGAGAAARGGAGSRSTPCRGAAAPGGARSGTRSGVAGGEAGVAGDAGESRTGGGAPGGALGRGGGGRARRPGVDGADVRGEQGVHAAGGAVARGGRGPGRACAGRCDGAVHGGGARAYGGRRAVDGGGSGPQGEGAEGQDGGRRGAGALWRCGGGEGERRACRRRRPAGRQDADGGGQASGAQVPGRDEAARLRGVPGAGGGAVGELHDGLAVGGVGPG